MTARGMRDIPLSGNKALVVDWNFLRDLARKRGLDLHQHADLFELVGGETGVNHEVLRFNTLKEVQDFLEGR